MSQERKITVVAPFLNEETNILPFYQQLSAALDQLDEQAEIIFVDDGSTDRSCRQVLSIAREDVRVKCLRLSRNFGTHAAYLAGLKRAVGDAAIIISVDLQDPPSLIPELISKWREGSHVVWAVRETRDDPIMKKVFASLFYKLFRKIALPNYPEKGMDFGLFDRQVLDSLKEFKEANHFFTGLVLWLGFHQTQVPYIRQARHSGTSKWPFSKRLKNALDGIVSFSYFPIRFISYAGLFVSLISFLYAGLLIARKLFLDLSSPGWASIMVVVLFLGGVQLTMLGVVGEYIWRGTEQSRQRPQYLVLEEFGFDASAFPSNADVQGD